MTSELAELIEIKTPGKLRAVVDSLKEFSQINKISQTKGNCKLESLYDDKILPDFINIEIVEHSTNFKFKLSVETYHGSGGVFERIK